MAIVTKAVMFLSRHISIFLLILCLKENVKYEFCYEEFSLLSNAYPELIFTTEVFFVLHGYMLFRVIICNYNNNQMLY